MGFSPLSLIGLMLVYGIVQDDKAVVAGLGAGYIAFLAAL